MEENKDEWEEKISEVLSKVTDHLKISDFNLSMFKNTYISKLYDKMYLSPLSELKAIQGILGKWIEASKVVCKHSYLILALVGELFYRRFKFTYCVYKTRTANKRLYQSYIAPLMRRRNRGMEKPNHHTCSQYMYLYRLIPDIKVIAGLKEPDNFSTNNENNLNGSNSNDNESEVKNKWKNSKLDTLGISLETTPDRIQFCLFSDPTEYGRLFECELESWIKIIMEGLELSSELIKIRTGNVVDKYSEKASDDSIFEKVGVLKEYGLCKRRSGNRDNEIQALMKELGKNLEVKGKIQNYNSQVKALQNHFVAKRKKREIKEASKPPNTNQSLIVGDNNGLIKKLIKELSPFFPSIDDSILSISL